MLKVVSLFSGIGGFEDGLDYYDIPYELELGCEIEPNANRAYKMIHNPKRMVEDVRQLEVLPECDILIGGFPCQAFSMQGKRGGFEDTRGTLFFEIARLCSGERRPKWLFLENVKGLLTHDNGRTLETILRTLTELGYLVDFRLIESTDFGVAAKRPRVYIVGRFGGVSEVPTTSGLYVDDQLKIDYFTKGVKFFNFFDSITYPMRGSKVRYIRDELDKEVTMGYLDREIELAGGSDGVLRESGIRVYGDLVGVSYRSNREVLHKDGYCCCMTRGIGEKVIYDGVGLRKLSASEILRLGGFSDKIGDILKANFTRTQIGGFVGNSVTPQVVGYLIKELVGGCFD